MPEFFFSYASLDAKHSDHLKKFMDELKVNVRDRTDLTLDQIGFYAGEDIATGDVWKQVLGEAVRTCKVLICLCSPSYYNSSYCGKELWVFLKRRIQWEKQTPGQQAPFILPVIWVKKSQRMPKVFTDILQAHDKNFPPSYNENGLKKLIELKGWGDGSEYKQVVVRLGDLIEEALEKNPALPHFPPPIEFNNLGNAFDEPEHHALEPYGVMAVLASSASSDWRPYNNGPTVARLLEETFSRMGLNYQGKLKTPGISVRLDEAEVHRQMVIVLVNPLSADPDMLAELNAKPRSNVAVLVPWPDALIALPEAERAKHETVLRQALSVYSGDTSGSHDFSNLRSAEQLRQRVEMSTTQLRLKLHAAGQPMRKAEDAAAIVEAQSQGITVTSMPTLGGPGESR